MVANSSRTTHRKSGLPTKRITLNVDIGTIGLGLNPGAGKDVCKRIVPSRHGGTISSRRAASPLARLVEEEERWVAPDLPQVSSLKIGVETSQIVLLPAWCSKLRITIDVT
ncbi:hypothetical protein TNCV_4107251 [Trichonephila clavipes]|nr:hypothetical protein TNCV_4107251 [Trichonephila clavipes]